MGTDMASATDVPFASPTHAPIEPAATFSIATRKIVRRLPRASPYARIAMYTAVVTPPAATLTVIGTTRWCADGHEAPNKASPTPSGASQIPAPQHAAAPESKTPSLWTYVLNRAASLSRRRTSSGTIVNRIPAPTTTSRPRPSGPRESTQPATRSIQGRERTPELPRCSDLTGCPLRSGFQSPRSVVSTPRSLGAWVGCETEPDPRFRDGAGSEPCRECFCGTPLAALHHSGDSSDLQRQPERIDRHSARRIAKHNGGESSKVLQEKRWQEQGQQEQAISALPADRYSYSGDHDRENTAPSEHDCCGDTNTRAGLQPGATVPQYHRLDDESACDRQYDRVDSTNGCEPA